MAIGVDIKRTPTFQLKLADEERAALEAYVAEQNARMPLGRVTMTDVIRASIRDYLRRNATATPDEASA
jgi:hypothetical protein